MARTLAPLAASISLSLSLALSSCYRWKQLALLSPSVTHSLPWLWLCLGKTARRRHSELGCPKHACTPSVPLSSGCEIKLLWLDRTMAKPVFHHFRQYLFSSYHVPDTIAGTGVTTMKTRCTIATALTFPLPVLLNCAATLSFSMGRHIPGFFFF